MRNSVESFMSIMYVYFNFCNYHFIRIIKITYLAERILGLTRYFKKIFLKKILCERIGKFVGKVYIVGAGPGDEELITIKGLRAIKEADIILYDRLVNKKLLEYARSDATCIFCGKKPNMHGMIQDQINEQLVSFAKSGYIVTRLKGGDPFIFGRGGEEALLLEKNKIIYEIVPGITAGISAAAYAGIPLTHRDISGSVSFINGSNPQSKTIEEWRHLANGAETLCFYMGVKNFPIICSN